MPKVGTILTVLLVSGCSSLWKKPVAEDLVVARQMSLEGIDHLQDGRFEEAEELFRDAIEHCPVDERARRCYADSLWRRGELELAIPQMEEALRLSGGDPELVVRLGEMYLATGDLDRATASSVRGIHANNRMPAAWALRGDVLKAQGNTRSALASYHRAISLQEHYPQVRVAIARIYQEEGRSQRALATLSILHSNGPDETIPKEVLFLEGLALKTLGRYDDSVDRLTAAARSGGPSADVLFHLGEAELLAGDDDKARRAVMKALNVNPHHVGGQRLIAWLNQKQQRMAAAPDRR